MSLTWSISVLIGLLLLTDVLLLLILLAIHRKRSATSFRIRQEGDDMAITGIHVGGSGNFTAKPNGALQAGDIPVWSADDTLVTIVAAADGLSAAVTVPSTDTGTTFNLSVTGVNSLGSKISSSVPVPILPAPATAFDIEQTS